MKLNDEEQDILAGKLGSLPQQALAHQIKVGDFFDARDFVPVSQAHIMADTESLGEAGVRWLEHLASTTEGQRTVRVPPSPIHAAPTSPTPLSSAKPIPCWIWSVARLRLSSGSA